MEVLHFTGYDFSLWRNDKIVIFDKGMFVWWFKEDDQLWMYFKNWQDLGKARALMLETYQDIMEVVHQQAFGFTMYNRPCEYTVFSFNAVINKAILSIRV